jgi:phosphoribosyl 1,2-cyclic phosphodiesterase
MSLQFCFLASGSGGNCTLVRTPAGVMLIDAGIGPRTAATRMRGTGVGPADISAICLTHLDRDHFNLNWIGPALRRNIPIFCHRTRTDDLTRIAGQKDLAPLLRPFGEAPFQPLPGLSCHGIELAHDEEGSHGFVIEGFGGRAGFATDLGHVPSHLIERFESLNLLALESNYDPQMQRESARPAFLKQRIMGGRGHLSNEQAFTAVRAILDRCEKRRKRLPDHIVLLHRSRQCNCPNLVRSLFERDARIGPRLILTEQDQRTEWLGPSRAQIGEQLLLGWSQAPVPV